MPKNTIQFQKGLSLRDFLENYGSEEKCRQALYQLRWPAGCEHIALFTGGGRRSAQLATFKWVNTMLGNVKNALLGIFHAIREKHAPRYLAEFEYRFNR